MHTEKQQEDHERLSGKTESDLISMVLELESELSDCKKDAERYREISKHGFAWRGCYSENCKPGEWIYTKHGANSAVDAFFGI